MFDADVWNSIWNRYKRYERFKNSGRKIDKGSFKKAGILLKKTLIVIVNFTLQKK